MNSLFYEAWAELDELDEALGIDPVKLPDHCAALDGGSPTFSGSCSIRRPCAYCSMVKEYGHDPSVPRTMLSLMKRGLWW